jgi:hypothetical protein
MLPHLRQQTPTRAVPLAQPLGVNHLQQHQVLFATVLYVCPYPASPHLQDLVTGCALSLKTLFCAAGRACALHSSIVPLILFSSRAHDHALRQTTRSARSRVEATGVLYRYLILLALHTAYNHVCVDCGLWCMVFLDTLGSRQAQPHQ